MNLQTAVLLFQNSYYTFSTEYVCQFIMILQIFFKQKKRLHIYFKAFCSCCMEKNVFITNVFLYLKIQLYSVMICNKKKLFKTHSCCLLWEAYCVALFVINIIIIYSILLQIVNTLFDAEHFTKSFFFFIKRLCQASFCNS